MSDRVRDILFIVFFIYCIATQYMITNYEKVNSKLLIGMDNLMGVCTNGEAHDLLRTYNLYEQDTKD